MTYEVEHGVTLTEPKKTRRPDMSTFTARFASTQETTTNTNRHATSTGADTADLHRLLGDQLTTLLASSSTSSFSPDTSTTTNPSQHALLESMLSTVATSIDNPTERKGVQQSFLDELDRVPRRSLRKDDECPICGNAFLEDEYPLVVALPCQGAKHWFDLECVGPWLLMNGTCPMDRRRVAERKVVVPVDDEEEDDGMFA